MSTSRSSYRSAALILLCLGQLMCILDISIVNIAIPSIQEDLQLVHTSLQWLVTAYVLTYGGFLLVGGRLGDLYGRRKVLICGLGIFTLASALGGMSSNAGMLLAARAGQGFGGAIITPTVMSFIAGLYSEGKERNRALGVLGAVTGAGFALGLVLGGLLTSTVGWRWVFFINLPIGILVIVLALWLLPETRREQQAVNIPGAILATSGLAMATYTLAMTEQYGLFSGRILIFLVATALLFYLFTIQERRAADPLIPPGLLRHGSLAKAVVGSSTFGAIVGPSTLLLTLYLQGISELDPLRAGLAFLPQEVTVFLAASLGGRYVTRFGSRNVLLAGIVAFGMGSICLAQMSSAGGYIAVVMPGLLLMGLGIGSVNVAGSIAATEGVPPLQHGVSTGIWNTGTQIGTALGLSVTTAIASGRSASLLATTPHIGRAAALVSGYRLAFMVTTGFAVAGMVALYIIGRRSTGVRPAPSGNKAT